MKLACPKCAAEIPPASANLAEGICTCPRCQEFFKIAAFLQDDAIAARVPKPPGTEIDLVVDRDEIGLMIPPGRARGTAWFFILFTGFWNAITWTFVIVTLRQPQLFPMLFMIPFVAVGLITLLCAAFFLKGEFTLAIDRQECRGIWTLFGKNFVRKFPTAQISDVSEQVVYTRNNQPVFGIGIQCGKKTLKFGSSLKDDERKWLIGELRHFLRLSR